MQIGANTAGLNDSNLFGLTSIKLGPLEFKPQEYLVCLLLCVFLEMKGLFLVLAYAGFKYYSYTQMHQQVQRGVRRRWRNYLTFTKIYCCTHVPYFNTPHIICYCRSSRQGIAQESKIDFQKNTIESIIKIDFSIVTRFTIWMRQYETQWLFESILSCISFVISWLEDNVRKSISCHV